jgi:hypothetical protein
MAVRTMVRIVDRYLAQYRYVFQANAECREALLKILDRFVRAGWPEARRLSYRLDEAFR